MTVAMLTQAATKEKQKGEVAHLITVRPATPYPTLPPSLLILFYFKSCFLFSKK